MTTKLEWFGHAAHFICGHRCRFHLATLVNDKWLVSTVGEMWSERPTREIHAKYDDPKWLAKHRELKGDNFDAAYMERFGFEEIGCDRKYETMVFRAGERCASPTCGCGLPRIDGSELDFGSYNAPADACWPPDVPTKTPQGTVEEARARCLPRHYYCDDPWYSCPMADGGCADDNVDPAKCNCEYAEREVALDALIAASHAAGRRGAVREDCGGISREMIDALAFREGQRVLEPQMRELREKAVNARADTLREVRAVVAGLSAPKLAHSRDIQRVLAAIADLSEAR